MMFCIIVDFPFNYFPVPSSKLRRLLAIGLGKQMWSPLESTIRSEAANENNPLNRPITIFWRTVVF